MTSWLEAVLRDLRLGLRQLRRRPGFVAASVVTLALGIGANTAMFSVIYGVLLKPLPFPDADRIVSIWGTIPARDIDQMSFAEANTWDLIDMNQSFAEMGSYHDRSFSLTGDGVPERVDGATVSVGLNSTGPMP